MRLGLSRRGGPAGRCHPWLKLSKHHAELRKLIPLYFPANNVASTHDSSTVENSQEIIHGSNESRIMQDVNKIKQEENECHKNPLAEKSENIMNIQNGVASESIKQCVKDILWNIDNDATVKLHESMNTSLIYQSLNMSPIHWKCVPQIHGLSAKHCAALCGVIIKKKRKKVKRIHQLPTGSPHNTKIASPQNSPRASKSDVVTQSQTDTVPSQDTVTIDPSDETQSQPKRSKVSPHDQSHPIDPSSPKADRATTTPVQSPQKRSSPDKFSTPPHTEAQTNVSPSTNTPVKLPTKGDEDDSGMEVNNTVVAANPTPSWQGCHTCRLCQRVVQPGSRFLYRFCGDCYNLIEQFGQHYTRSDDLICLRDTPCPSQWPAHPFDPAMPHAVKSAFRLSQQKHGFVAPEWCIPCKVVHCMRLGFKFTTLRTIPTTNTQALNSVDLTMLDDPVFQHRGRERCAQPYLTQLAADYQRVSQNLVANAATDHDEKTATVEQQSNSKPSRHITSALSRFLDMLWVRPVRLASRTQLKEIAELVSDGTCLPLTDVAKNQSSRFATDEIATCSYEKEASAIKQELITVPSITDSKNVTYTRLDSMTDSTDRVETSSIVPNEPCHPTGGALPTTLSISKAPASSPSPKSLETTQAPLTTQLSCPFCRFRSNGDKIKAPEVSMSMELDVARQMLQQNIYAITLGPVRIRSRARGLASVDRVRSVTTSSRPTEDVIVTPSEKQGVANQSSPIDPVSSIAQPDVEPPGEVVSNVTTKRIASDTAVSEPSNPVRLDALPTTENPDPGPAPPVINSETAPVPGELMIADTRPIESTHNPNDFMSVNTSEQQTYGLLINQDDVQSNETKVPKGDENSDPVKPSKPGMVLQANPVISDIPLVCEKLAVLPTSSSETVHNPLVEVKEDNVVRTEQPSAYNPHSPCPGSNLCTHSGPQFNTHKHFDTEELQICAICLQDFREALRRHLHQFYATSVDCVADLMICPLSFCHNKETVAPSQVDSHSLPGHAGCGHCDSCFLVACLIELCAIFEPDLAQLLPVPQSRSESLPTTEIDRTGCFTQFFLPVGGPLIFGCVAVPKNPDDSFYGRRLPPTATLTTNTPIGIDDRPSCLCCQSSTALFLNRYLVTGDSVRAVCSGCLWTFINAVHVAYHDPGVQRIARRLASAAAATDASVPLLSSASRRTLVDTARLAQFLATPCSGACENTQSDGTREKPMWLACPGCVVRRLHRLLPTRLPLRCPRWYRRRVQLTTRAKSIEDLDPRLMCPQKMDTTTSNRLTLVDVEYTNAVIERWLLPPEPPMAADRCTDMVCISDSDSAESSDTDPLVSDASSAVSTDVSPLHFSDHETDYGANSWWDDALEYADDDGTKVDDDDGGRDDDEDDNSEKEEQKVADVSIHDDTTAPKDSSTEPDDVFLEELPTTAECTATSKRQRRMTAKAAEAAADSRRRSRTTTANTPKHTPEKSVSADVTEVKSDLTVDTIISENQNEVAITENQETEVNPVVEPPSPRDEEPCDLSNIASVATTTTTATTEVNVEASEADESSKQTDNLVGPETSPQSEPEPQRPAKLKRKASPLAEPLIRSKRSLKYNPRFFEDYTGDFPSLVGEGRQIRDSSPVEEDDVESDHTNDCMESGSRRSSDRRSSRHGSQGRTDSATRLSSSSRTRGETKQGRHSTPITNEEEETRVPYSSQKPTGLGPRVKQVSRHALKPDYTERYAPTMSAMVHAARLAAVGAKIPGGTSPNHAALAATIRATDLREDSDDPMSHEDSETGATTGSRKLPERCGQCAACIGLVQACGSCTNCRLLQQQALDGNNTRNTRIGPCKELICFRRRAADNGTGKVGPRVKIPTTFSSSNANGSSNSTYAPHSTNSLQKPPPGGSFLSGSSSNTRQHRSQPHSTASRPGESPASVSLFETVPGLAQQLDADAWLAQSDRDESRTTLRGKSLFASNARHDSINVYSQRPLTPINGGDLGMRFNGSNHKDHVDADKDRIRPIEGEVITSELAHHGGYAIVTTVAAAPPKEICYACGSGGGQLLFCVSCAEPYHFYCVERQFRPRRKDHFICRNCTECRYCHKPAADLRCLRCSGGYHPACLTDYPPAHTGQRGNWVCPSCATCVHCGTKPLKTTDSGDPKRATSSSTDSTSAITFNSTRVSVIPWSVDVNKCAACSLAEARGDVCPECDRAYLPTAKQMIQCDNCQLWMHRTCTKLTVDEYEWIARLSPERLSKFVVNCSVCQKEKRQQQGSRALTDGTCTRDEDHPLTVDVFSNPNGTSSDAVTEIEKTDGAARLRSLARDTLMERMAGLVASCRQSIHSNSPSPSLSNEGVSPSWGQRHPSGDSDHASQRRIPQFDGAGDSESSEDDSATVWSSKSFTPSKSFKVRKRISDNTDNKISRASDVLLDDHPFGHSVKVPSNTPVITGRFGSCNTYMFSDQGVNARHSRNTYGGGQKQLSTGSRSIHHRSKHHDHDRFNQHSDVRLPMLSDGGKASGRSAHSLPINAAWLVEEESESIWTSPRALIFRLLTRLIHQLSSQPTNSPRALTLRRLLRWLTVTTETSFPWLHVSDMTSDVRDVLRQTGGNFSAVLKHFELLALIEQKELLCPIVARISETQLHSRMLPSGLRAPNCMTTVQICHATIMQHLKAHHAHAITQPVPNHIPDEWRSLAVAKLSTTRIQPSQCHRPHEIEVMERMRNEAREERWVEHWSAIEEDMVLHYFQRHLLRERNRLMRLSQNTRKALQNTCEDLCHSPDLPTESLPITAPLKADPVVNDTDDMLEAAVMAQPPTSSTALDPLDEAFQDVDSVLAADQRGQPDALTPALTLATPEPKLTGAHSDVEQLQSTVATFSDKPAKLPLPSRTNRIEVEKFYFARDDFWTAALGCTAPPDSDGRHNENQLDLDPDSADEDIRCCLLCGHHGDGNIEGRLLFTGADTWVHVNCALWSNEVYEEETGQLIGLSDALRRGRTSLCADCGRYGATMVCSNGHDSSCSLRLRISNPQCYHPDGRPPPQGCSACFSEGMGTPQAVHFACALRRRPPLPRSVFTADRSWFCSPECHHNTERQRLTDGINEMRRVRRQRLRQKQKHHRHRRDQLRQEQQRDRSARFELAGSDFDDDVNGHEDDVFENDEQLFDALSNPFADPLLDNEELLELKNAVADDLEPISLGELLVCRRVFVPSDCFAASLYPAAATVPSSSYKPWIAPDDNPKLQVAAQMACKNLSASPNSLAFLLCSGLPATSLVITIGSLRIDRLGEVREASDSLAMAKSYHGDSMAAGGFGGATARRWNYLCPINYRARRIYWSCTKLDARISYTLHVRQSHVVHQTPSHMPYDPPVAKPPNRTAGQLGSFFSNSQQPRHADDLHTAASKPKTFPMRTLTVPDRKDSTTALTGDNVINTGSVKTSQATNALTSMPVLDPVPSWRRYPISSDSPKRPIEISMKITNLPTTSSDVTPSHCNPVSNLTVPVVGGNLSCRVSAPSLDSCTSSVKILKTESLAKGIGVSQSCQTQITYSTTVSSATTTAATTESASSSTSVFRSTAVQSTFSMTPGTFQRQPFHSSSLISSIATTTSAAPSFPSILTSTLTATSTMSERPLVIVDVVQSQPRPPIKPTPVTQRTSGTTVRLTGHTGGGVIRIQNLTGQRAGGLVTPTKDLQLAIQLNGLFQNLPTSRPLTKHSSLPLSNPCRQLPIHGPDSSQVLRTETHTTSAIVTPRLLPQLDGTLDVVEDDCPDIIQPLPRKRGRPPGRGKNRNKSGKVKSNPQRRTSSVTSNDSSASGRNYCHGYQHRRKRRPRSTSSSTAASGQRRVPPQRHLPKEPKLLSPPTSPRGQPMRRRWIEERNRQQELAHLVSKAKQANQARLYQNEVEKHARAFRLRFAIDGVVRAAANPAVAWQTILGRVAALRERHGLPPLIYSYADGWTQFGLNHRHVIFLIEQMCGAFHCYRYKFQYHRSKIERLRHKFTPPVPVVEGCARALMWTKPRLPANHARDPLNFLRCAANPPPRPLFKPGQAPPCSRGQLTNSAIMSTPPALNTGAPSSMILSPGEPATLLSPNEQLACVEAARQAAALVAAQLRLPMRVRKACIARAVVQATGLPVDGVPGDTAERQNATSVDGSYDKGGNMNKTAAGPEGDQRSGLNDSISTAEDDDDGEGMEEEPEEEEEEDALDFGTVSTQFKRLNSGPLARLLRVAVHPSRIHGRGLFALRGFREDEMVIEYMGELIRNLVCETREVRYRAAGVDCYMFRIDPDWVIDATYAGNAARFINHSCEPNCYAKVISVDDKKHIVILAQRRIYPGEELTYDYRFPKESDKLLCNCGSYMCRRYLN